MSGNGPGLYFKVVLLGEGRVGKTSLVLRYIQGTFNDRQESTIQATYLEKNLKVGDHKVTLSVWDTAGQERFHALGPIYYRNADGALLVYDITDADTFHKVKSWVKELRKVVGPDIFICIAGNKCDLVKHRQVEEKEAVEYAQSVGANHILTSAKLNKGVEEAFMDLTKRMVRKKVESDGTDGRSQRRGGAGGARLDDGGSSGQFATNTGGGRGLRVVDDSDTGITVAQPQQPQQKKGCCG